MSASKVKLWLRGMIAATITGAAGGICTGLAAVGIDPQHFNFNNGTGHLFKIALVAALIHAVIGVAAYLQKSPLPETE
jgi:hypothetical protein